MSGTNVLERVAKLEALIQPRLDEIETTRRVPLDIIDQLKAAGCFRLAVPADYGGEDATLAEMLAVYEEASRIDASVGWVAMIGGVTTAVFSALPPATFASLCADGPDVIGGAVLAPKGIAVLEDGGYRASGQWPFGSGSEHSDWLGVNCIILEDGAPRMTPTGMPEMRILVLPRDEVEIVDTWYVVGLKGSGSQDLRLDGALVPTERTMMMFGEPQVDSTLFRIPILGLFTLTTVACAVGIAQGALDEVSELVASKRPAFKPDERVAENQLARFDLGRADMMLRAARALMYEQAASAWEVVDRGGELTMTERARMHSTGWQGITMAKEVVEIAYSLGGGTSLYDTCTLQRRMRDIHAVSQHIAASRDPVMWLGGFLAGEEMPEARV
jgi:alkylation response protein AidB-like acyl-CoA dehydrogenase